MNNEIKVGDKVRVSKDAPEMYFYGCNYDNSVCKVILVDRDNAVITQVKNGSFVIPTKYLTKVDAEEKEPKFKVGEIVRYRYDGKLYIVECKTGKYYYALRQVGGDIMMHDVLESDLELVTEPKQEIKVGDVIDTPKGKGTVRIPYGDYWVVQLDNGEWYIHMETNMPYAPHTEPKEQTEAEEDARIRQMEAELEEFIKAQLDRVLHPEKYHTYEVTVDNVAMNWQHYEADLAKEVAVKLSKPNKNKPGYVADYAVSVAKAVVENLKKK